MEQHAIKNERSFEVVYLGHHSNAFLPECDRSFSPRLCSAVRESILPPFIHPPSMFSFVGRPSVLLLLFRTPQLWLGGVLSFGLLYCSSFLGSREACGKTSNFTGQRCVFCFYLSLDYHSDTVVIRLRAFLR